MDAPQYIWGLLGKELRRCVMDAQYDLLEKVATKYDIPLQQLMQDFMGGEHHDAVKPEMTTKRKVKIQIRRINDPRPPAEDDERCAARVWNRGKGGQCTRKRKDAESCYCAQHITTRKHGDIHDKVPRDIYPNQKKSLYA